MSIFLTSLPRSGIFPLEHWESSDHELKTLDNLKRNISTHWYKHAMPETLEAHFILPKKSDFFEVLLATENAGSYGVRVQSGSLYTFFDALDGSRNILKQVVLPTQTEYSAIIDTTDDNLFMAFGGQLLSTKEIPYKTLKKIGAATNLSLAEIKQFTVRNTEGELQKLVS
ncbi:MAG: hypothetical protein R3A13_03630 [Bdellovibrionota bacterium]